MELDEALTERANRDDALTAIFAGNVHWVVRPQGMPLPALIFQEIGEERPEDLDGDEEMRTARVQIDSLAATKAQSKAGIEAAIAALRPEAEVGGIVFWRAGLDGPRALGEQTDTGFIHRANADLIIRYAKIS